MTPSVSWQVLGAAFLLLGCDGTGTTLDLERMREQPRYDAYEASGAFADGKVLQHPPGGTISRERVVDRPLVTRGEIEGRYAERVPIAVTPELLALGRSRFNVFCAVCHGAGGYGGSIVAANMGENRPASLRRPEMRAHPPGMLYHHIVQGPGRMPSYRAELSVRERWAVVAYLTEMQRSDHVPSPEEREDSLRARQLRRLDAGAPKAGVLPRGISGTPSRSGAPARSPAESRSAEDSAATRTGGAEA